MASRPGHRSSVLAPVRRTSKSKLVLPDAGPSLTDAEKRARDDERRKHENAGKEMRSILSAVTRLADDLLLSRASCQDDNEEVIPLQSPASKRISQLPLLQFPLPPQPPQPPKPARQINPARELFSPDGSEDGNGDDDVEEVQEYFQDEDDAFLEFTESDFPEAFQEFDEEWGMAQARHANESTQELFASFNTMERVKLTNAISTWIQGAYSGAEHYVQQSLIDEEEVTATSRSFLQTMETILETSESRDVAQLLKVNEFNFKLRKRPGRMQRGKMGGNKNEKKRVKADVRDIHHYRQAGDEMTSAISALKTRISTFTTGEGPPGQGPHGGAPNAGDLLQIMADQQEEITEMTGRLAQMKHKVKTYELCNNFFQAERKLRKKEEALGFVTFGSDRQAPMKNLLAEAGDISDLVLGMIAEAREETKYRMLMERTHDNPELLLEWMDKSSGAGELARMKRENDELSIDCDELKLSIDHLKNLRENGGELNTALLAQVLDERSLSKKASKAGAAGWGEDLMDDLEPETEDDAHADQVSLAMSMAEQMLSTLNAQRDRLRGRRLSEQKVQMQRRKSSALSESAGSFIAAASHNAEIQAKLEQLAAAEQSEDVVAVESIRNDLRAQGVDVGMVPTSAAQTPDEALHNSKPPRPPGLSVEAESKLKRLTAAQQNQDDEGAAVIRNELRAHGIDADLVLAAAVQNADGTIQYSEPAAREKYDAQTSKKLDELAAAKHNRDGASVEAIRKELCTQGIDADMVLGAALQNADGTMQYSVLAARPKYDVETSSKLDQLRVAKQTQDVSAAEAVRKELRAQGIDADVVIAGAVQSPDGTMQYSMAAARPRYDADTEKKLEQLASAKQSSQGHGRRSSIQLTGPAIEEIREDLRARGIDADVALKSTAQNPDGGMRYDAKTEEKLDRLAAAKRSNDETAVEAICKQLHAQGIDPDMALKSAVQHPDGTMQYGVPAARLRYDEITEKNLDRLAEAKQNQDVAVVEVIRNELCAQGIDADCALASAVQNPDGTTHYSVPAARPRYNAETEKKLERLASAKQNQDIVTVEAICTELRAQGIDTDIAASVPRSPRNIVKVSDTGSEVTQRQLTAESGAGSEVMSDGRMRTASGIGNEVVSRDPADKASVEASSTRLADAKALSVDLNSDAQLLEAKIRGLLEKDAAADALGPLSPRSQLEKEQDHKSGLSSQVQELQQKLEMTCENADNDHRATLRAQGIEVDESMYSTDRSSKRMTMTGSTMAGSADAGQIGLDDDVYFLMDIDDEARAKRGKKSRSTQSRWSTFNGDEESLNKVQKQKLAAKKEKFQQDLDEMSALFNEEAKMRDEMSVIENHIRAKKNRDAGIEDDTTAPLLQKAASQSHGTGVPQQVLNLRTDVMKKQRELKKLRKIWWERGGQEKEKEEKKEKQEQEQKQKQRVIPNRWANCVQTVEEPDEPGHMEGSMGLPQQIQGGFHGTTRHKVRGSVMIGGIGGPGAQGSAASMLSGFAQMAAQLQSQMQVHHNNVQPHLPHSLNSGGARTARAVLPVVAFGASDMPEAFPDSPLAQQVRGHREPMLGGGNFGGAFASARSHDVPGSLLSMAARLQEHGAHSGGGLNQWKKMKRANNVQGLATNMHNAANVKRLYGGTDHHHRQRRTLMGNQHIQAPDAPPVNHLHEFALALPGDSNQSRMGSANRLAPAAHDEQHRRLGSVMLGSGSRSNSPLPGLSYGSHGSDGSNGKPSVMAPKIGPKRHIVAATTPAHGIFAKVQQALKLARDHTY